MLLTILLSFFLIFALVLFFIIMSAFVTFLVTRVPFVPTPSVDISKLAEHLGINETHTVYDLGSGSGTASFAFARAGAGGVRGMERGLWMLLWARAQKQLTGSRAEFAKANFFSVSWTEANVIYCYLYPPLMRRIGEKAKQDLKPGSIVVSRDFPIPNLGTPEVLKTGKHHEFYIYKV